MVAIIASLLVISVYVALRFEWKFAVPVLIALMHDLLITSGVYALTGREVTVDTVAALLTILGYSMYDTIIVFDRVRENIPRMPRAAFSQIVNRSMSEVLTRSIATTSCTLMPIIALLLFGGSTLKDFAFALLIGVASGAYSSIFIASPVLTHWKEREPAYRARRQRIEAELGMRSRLRGGRRRRRARAPTRARARRAAHAAGARDRLGGGVRADEARHRRARKPSPRATPRRSPSASRTPATPRRPARARDAETALGRPSRRRSASRRPAPAPSPLTAPTSPERRDRAAPAAALSPSSRATATGTGSSAAPDEAENEGVAPAPKPAGQPSRAA